MGPAFHSNKFPKRGAGRKHFGSNGRLSIAIFVGGLLAGNSVLVHMYDWGIYLKTQNKVSSRIDENMSTSSMKGFKHTQVEDAAVSILPPLPEMNVPLYDFDSAPRNVVIWAKNLLGTPDVCESDPTSLIASCCWKSCGGVADRTRGIASLLILAERTSRKLCLSKNYFLAAPRPNCAPNSSYVLTAGGTHSFMIFSDASMEKSAKWVHLGKKVFYNRPELRTARYVSTNAIADFKLSPSLSGSAVDAGIRGAISVSMLALVMSGVLNEEFLRARRAISASVGLYSRNNSFISLHVRCGGSAFRSYSGHQLRHTTSVDNSFQFFYPDLILKAARRIPRNTICSRPLYISSDSILYRTELELAFPRGVVILNCCSAPGHMDKGLWYAQNFQHLVDLEAFAESEKIFATGGGYSRVGAYAKSWVPVPAVNLNRMATEEEVDDFVVKILRAMKCTRGTSRQRAL